MKGIGSKITKAINVGTYLRCADNTGAKVLQVIAVKGYKGVRRRYPRAGIADIVYCSVKKGVPKLRKQVVMAVIVRQRKEFRRPNGLRVKFEDNAGVLINEKLEPRGSEIKGPIAKEVVERFPAIGKIATIVV